MKTRFTSLLYGRGAGSQLKARVEADHSSGADAEMLRGQDLHDNDLHGTSHGPRGLRSDTINFGFLQPLFNAFQFSLTSRSSFELNDVSRHRTVFSIVQSFHRSLQMASHPNKVKIQNQIKESTQNIFDVKFSLWIDNSLSLIHI